MNASQLASYDYFKRILLSIKGTQDGPVLQFGASFLAGTVATSTHHERSSFRHRAHPFPTAVCAPADVVKSRVMAAKSGAEVCPRVVFLPLDSTNRYRRAYLRSS